MLQEKVEEEEEETLWEGRGEISSRGKKRKREEREFGNTDT